MAVEEFETGLVDGIKYTAGSWLGCPPSSSRVSMGLARTGSVMEKCPAPRQASAYV